MALFRPRELRPGTAGDDLLRQLNEIQKEIARDISAALGRRKMSEVIIASTYAASFGEVVRIAPPSGGTRLVLPAPNLGALDSRITAVVEAASGALSVEVVDGLINGSTTLTYLAGIGTVEFVLTATGWYAWSVSLVADLPLTALASQADDTVVANLSGGAAKPTATTIATLATRLRGIGLTVSAGKLLPRRRPRAAQMQDYFCSGNNTTGQIGALGWNLLGVGTPAYARGTPTVMGSSNRALLSTSGVANDRTCLVLGETESRDILPASEMDVCQCVWNFNAGLTSKRVFFGLLDSFANEPSASTDCLGIYYDSAVGTNYQILARSGGSGTPTDTGAAVPSNTAELITIWQHSTGSYRFYSGATLLGTIASGIPTNAMNLGFRVETLTAAARSINIGYFGLEARAANAYDDDSFLEV